MRISSDKKQTRYDNIKPADVERRLKLLYKSAKNRNISVDLPKNLYAQLINLGCTYCGKNLGKERGYCIDRFDNNHGYHSFNCIPCCKYCNKAKGTLTHKEFIELAQRVADYQKYLKDRVGDYTEEDVNNMMQGFYSQPELVLSEFLKLDGER